MPQISRPRRRHVALLLTGAALAAAPAPAPAATGWRCEAAAATGSALAGAVALPDVRANRGATGCVADIAGGALDLPLPLDAAALLAQTAVSGPATDAGAQKVLATGAIADLRVRSLPDLPVTLPEITLPAGLDAFSVDLPTVPNPVPLLPPLLSAQTITVDLLPAVRALLPVRVLPELELLHVRGAVAYAAGQCINGIPRIAGASQVAGVSVAGQELPATAAIDRGLALLPGEAIDPSAIDLSLVSLPDGLSLDLPVVGSVIRDALQAAVDELPDIPVPATLAQVKVTPGEQVSFAGLLTQRALRVEVAIAGQQIADLTLGEATTGAGEVRCAQSPAQLEPESPTDLALQCTGRDLVLVDVFQRGGRVQLLGAADRRLAGRTVGIVFDATGRVVTRAKVASDGAFTTTAPLPPRSLRSGNRARYRAVLGRERSLNLKLQRRMVVEHLSARDGRVTVRGRVVGPLARPVAPVTVSRRVSCSRSEVVARFTPRRDGRFSISFAAPAAKSAAVYRLSTRVRKTFRNRKTFPTYTLPRAIDLLATP